MKRKEIKKQNIIQLLLLIITIVLVNYISSYWFFRIDLTQEKRHTISEHTKDYLKSLDDVVYFQIFLDGDLPYGFKKLQKSLKETLEEFRVYGKDNIQYEFFNPSESEDQKTRNEIYKQLYKKGIEPTNLQIKEKDGSKSQKIIFPGMLITFKGKETALTILQNNPLHPPETNLNNSIQNIEFELINASRKLSNHIKPKISFIKGHSELDENETADIKQTLSGFYNVSTTKIAGKLNSLVNFDLIIIAQPDSAFSEKDKFIIDQFIMNGGKVLWALDFVKSNMDSLAYTSSTISLNNKLNLDDILFKYGVRINYNLIQDIQCAVIPVNTAIAGAAAKFSPIPWLYFPLITPQNNHPITKNINLIKTEFVSAIDTVGNNNLIEKTILLKSSKYSKTVRTPIRISLELINQQPDPAQFFQSNLPIAVLLEGIFDSNYKNRLTYEIAKSDEIKFQEKSRSTKMIVIADGDIIRNQIQQSGNNIYPLPLGYDRYTKQTYGNKEFVMNSINYLLDDSGFMNIRNRELKLRLLDKQKINNRKIIWQIINIGLPLFFILLFGIFWNLNRKKKFAK